MKYGILVPGGDPRLVAEIAAEAEAAGWDGVFYWDAIWLETLGDMYDPWVVMTAIALRTSKVTIGALVTPPARRRPWKLAREAMSVDVVSGGRLVLPIGLGAIEDGAFGRVGEPVEKRILAERMDESLAILDGLWSGEPFGFRGEHYAFEPMRFLPRPVQRPRIPIWVVGAWPSEKSMARVARWDGLLPQKLPSAGPDPLSHADLRAMVAWIAERRGSLDGFEVVMDGNTDPAERAAAVDTAEGWREAGVTYWIEQNWADWSPDLVRGRIAAGPPRP
jgi:alkanesulfonate monooxygenase SsuD/methylene tetrahydromethanopterin reductase-like flavin-dependent oxidoreductase (luciferase family)